MKVKGAGRAAWQEVDSAGRGEENAGEQGVGVVATIMSQTNPISICFG